MEEACSIFEQKCNKIDLTLSLDSIQGIPRDSHQDAGEPAEKILFGIREELKLFG